MSDEKSTKDLSVEAAEALLRKIAAVATSKLMNPGELEQMAQAYAAIEAARPKEDDKRARVAEVTTG